MWGARGMAVLGLLGSALVGGSLVPPTPAVAADPQYCDEGRTPPCIVSVTRDGAPIVRSDYPILVDTFTPPDDQHETGFTMNKSSVGYGLGPAELGHVFSVTMNTGSIVPRIVDGWASKGSASRFKNPDGTWGVTVTLEPADMLVACSPTCPYTAPADKHIQYIRMGVSDAAWYSPVESERDDLWGLESYSNINLFWYPPQISLSPAGVVAMTFEMESSHQWVDGSGTTHLFQGQAHMRLPNRVLRRLYGIPNPETMTSGSFTSTSTSGSVASYQEAGDDAWRVDLTGVSFSQRYLTMRRGTIVPTRPTLVRTTRVTPLRGRVAFRASRPRGARVTGYVARCVVVGGLHTVRASAAGSPVVVRGLKPGRAYVCKVRATSRAGAGPWSLGVRMRARP